MDVQIHLYPKVEYITLADAGCSCSSCRVPLKSGLGMLLRHWQLTPAVPVE